MPKQGSAKKLTHDEFQSALIYTSIRENSRVIAYDYLVNGIPISNVAEKYSTSKQNVFNMTKRVLEGFQKYKEALTAVHALTKQDFDDSLPYSTQLIDISIKYAYLHLVEGQPLIKIAQEFDTTRQNVYGAAKRVIEAHGRYLDSRKLNEQIDKYAMTQEQFKALGLNLKDNQLQLAQRYFVQKKPIEQVATESRVTNYWAYSVISKVIEEHGL